MIGLHYAKPMVQDGLNGRSSSLVGPGSFANCLGGTSLLHAPIAQRLVLLTMKYGGPYRNLSCKYRADLGN